jgi:hypothetical protein
VRRILIGLLVLSSILLGALAAGTPVAGNDTVAAVTAGINLGTAPVRASTTHAVADVAPLRALLLALLLLLVAATTRWVDFREPARLVRSLVRGQTGDGRGPPTAS